VRPLAPPGTTGASRGRRRVLLLTSDTGAGHRSVSRALLDAAAEHPQLELIEVDPLAPLPAGEGVADGEARTVFDRIVAMYGPAIVRVPWLWGFGFRLMDNEAGLRFYLSFLSKRFEDRMLELVERTGAAAMVSVHPLVNHLMVRVRERLRRPELPLMTVLTDLEDVHHWWAAPGVDEYVASSDVAAARLADLGIPPARIAVLGIPIRRDFAHTAVSGREMRTKLGLDPDLPLLLLMGGGDGAGKLAETARAVGRLASDTKRFQLVVVTARNVKARNELEAESWPMPTRVLGFVSNIVEYMIAADVIATKPGSLTVSEGLALGRPLLLGKPLPGQEEGNVGYVVNAEAGLAYRSPTEAAEAFAYLLSDPTVRWDMGQNAARLGNPRAAERVIDLLQGMLMQTEGRMT
jgi:1,2-diacylglycerol 3-beta-galactosyltransferase